MLSYYNVHMAKNRGKNSRFPVHHWVASSMILCFFSDNLFFNWVYIKIFVFLSSSLQGGNESETKAVFIIGTLLQSETLDLIRSIVESSDFQHCTILCTVPENVHSFARQTEIADVSPFGELSQKLREWMGNMVSKK